MMTCAEVSREGGVCHLRMSPIQGSKPLRRGAKNGMNGRGGGCVKQERREKGRDEKREALERRICQQYLGNSFPVRIHWGVG